MTKAKPVKKVLSPEAKAKIEKHRKKIQEDIKEIRDSRSKH